MLCHSGQVAGGFARVRTWTAVILLSASALVAVAPSSFAAERRDAQRVLNSLPVSVERDGGYDRDLFAHWSDLDGDGCDTREEVLMDERTRGEVAGCRVVGGRWVSIYDGKKTTNSSSFDIDHFVPLKEAWRSGAWRWTPKVREQFANDLGYAGSLVAVSASSNRSKSDRDPSQWLPEAKRCLYAKTWIAVKYRWRLAVDTQEKSELRRILQGCAPLMRVPSLA